MNYDQLYDQLAQLPPEERAQMLRDLIPPAALAMRINGTAFAVHKYGLRLFETKGGLKDIGIPADDPRAKLYQTLSGRKIASDLPNRIRAIAAREETVGKQAGGVQVWGDGRYLWYVPTSATSKFVAAMQGLANEIAEVVEKELVAKYDQIRTESREAFKEASTQAWSDMHKLDRTTEKRGDYIQRSMGLFDAAFPSPEKIKGSIGMQIQPAQGPLPKVIETVFQDLQKAELEERRLAAEAYRGQAEAATLQRQLFNTQMLVEQEKLDAIQAERKVREQMLKDAIAPEVEQAHQMVAQFQSSLITVAGQIASALKEGKPVTAQTKKSWLDKLARLKELQSFNAPEIDEALRQLKSMVDAPQVATRQSIQVAERTVKDALTVFERDAHAEIGADAIWKMIIENKGENALQKIMELENRFQGRLSELEALHAMVADRLVEEEAE